MQVVILVAGRGTRMEEATIELPKPLLEAKGKTLLAHKLDLLPKEVDEIVLVIGYHGNLVREKIGEIYTRKQVRYVEQTIFNGTAGALSVAKDILKDEFLVMMGDDIYAREDVEACIKEEWAICAKKVENRTMGGELLFDESNLMVGINETRHFVETGYVNTGLYKLQKKYFDYKPQNVTGTNELGIPQTLVLCAKDFAVSVIVSDAPWIQISNQEDLKYFDSL